MVSLPMIHSREFFAMVPSEFLESFQQKWNEMLSSDEGGEKVKRLFAIDGKTQRGNGNKYQKQNHIVSAVDERGFCLGQKRVEEKTNEIKTIPELLNHLIYTRDNHSNGCHGNPDSYCKEDLTEVCRLCSGIKGKSGESAG